jgi:hypothetical protein
MDAFDEGEPRVDWSAIEHHVGRVSHLLGGSADPLTPYSDDAASVALTTQLRCRVARIADDRRLIQELKSGKTRHYVVFARGDGRLLFLIPEAAMAGPYHLALCESDTPSSVLGMAKQVTSKVLLGIAFRAYLVEHPGQLLARVRPRPGLKLERPRALLTADFVQRARKSFDRVLSTEDLRVLIDLSSRGGLLLRPLPGDPTPPCWRQLAFHECYAVETILGFHVDETIHLSTLHAIWSLQKRRRLDAIVCVEGALSEMHRDQRVLRGKSPGSC